MIIRSDLMINDKETAIDFIKENYDEETPLLTHDRIEELYYDDDALHFTFSQSNLPFSIFGTLYFTAGESGRSIAREMAKSVGIDREYRTDDRGRISLGSQYAGKDVRVAVIDVDEDEGESDE